VIIHATALLAQTPPVGDVKIIVVAGLLFVAIAALANGLSVTPATVLTPLKENVQLTIFTLFGNFVVIPALTAGFLLAIDFDAQVDLAFCLLALVAGAPFVAWMTSLGKGNIAYGAASSFMLMVATIVVMPLLLPALLSGVDSPAKPSWWDLFGPILLFLVVPLVVGLLVRWRHPEFAMSAATWLGPVSIAFLAMHIALMFAVYWDDFTDEFGSGEIAFTIGFAIVPLVIGYVLSPPYVLSPMRAMMPQHYGRKLAAEVTTAQKGSQMLICSLIFAFGDYAVAGVVALASSAITIVVIIVFVLEIGKRFTAKSPAATSGADPTAVAPAPAATSSAAPTAVAPAPGAPAPDALQTSKGTSS
jgi:bile acid:Na+ symporter, BASS family